MTTGENNLNMDMIFPSTLFFGNPFPIGAYVVAAEQGHAAEHTVVAADEFIKVFVAALVARVQSETRHLVDAGGADEILAHARRAAGGDAATALDAAV